MKLKEITMKIVITLLILLTVVILSCTACEADYVKEERAAKEAKTALNALLPTNATNIVDKGKGWKTFELDGETYLFVHGGAYRRGWQAITCITCCE